MTLEDKVNLILEYIVLHEECRVLQKYVNSLMMAENFDAHEVRDIRNDITDISLRQGELVRKMKNEK